MILTLVICRAEDLVLAEERTTEADKELIMEGVLHLKYCHLHLYIMACVSYILYIFMLGDSHRAAVLVL